MRAIAIAGSYRKDSINRQLLEVVSKRSTFDVDVKSLADFDVPPFNSDIEDADGLPAGAVALRDALNAYDALIISSPEYNLSIPGPLKNLIDWGSRFRPFPFKNVPTLLLSASPAMAGGSRGLIQLRVPLEYLGALVYPESFSLAVAHKAFEQGDLANEDLQARLDGLLGAFDQYANALSNIGN